jgi:hypothetical protein
MENTRTNQQNKAYHKWIKEVADECVEKGINLSVLFKDPGEVPVTKGSIHQGMTLRLAKVRYNKTSTTQLTTTEMSQVVEDVRGIISERSHGEVDLPFPSQELLNDNL